MIKKYQHKPVNAIQLELDMSNWREVCIFKNENDTYPDDVEDPEFLDIFTVFGWYEMLPGEWLIKDSYGDWYVQSDKEFRKKYDEVTIQINAY